ncbi:MAG: phosphoribosylamine--glycine ligase [Treponema sp.]|nr:phosphoribosylamine--glycine ligase [Treponema sp.]
MKILVIGSGGREHAMVWKLAQSEKVEALYAAPGNGGTAGEKKCVNIPVEEGDPASPEGMEGLVQFAAREKIDLTVVGPEAPLAAGIVDRFRAEGLAAAGPDQRAARLESSKVYAKAFMKKYGVRAAESRDFTSVVEALAHARKHFGGQGPAKPLVIKADGLAAGKGVVVAENLRDTEAALRSFMEEKTLGASGASVVLEDFLEGKEVSVLAAVSAVPCDRKGGAENIAGTIVPFISARDHKRRFDGGLGPNTGGMGAIAPAPDFTEACQKDFVTNILSPTLAGIKAEGLDYRGFIFFGLMIRDDVCSLLEYNVRLGDPETQAVLPLMDADFAALCLAIHDGSLGNFPLKWKPGAVCAPVAVAAGYPGDYRKGDPITVNEAALAKTGARLFVAGAQGGAGVASSPGLRTSGGRVLAVSALGSDAGEAREKAYRSLEAVGFEGMDYRRDIGREN